MRTIFGVIVGVAVAVAVIFTAFDTRGYNGLVKVATDLSQSARTLIK